MVSKDPRESHAQLRHRLHTLGRSALSIRRQHTGTRRKPFRVRVEASYPYPNSIRYLIKKSNYIYSGTVRIFEKAGFKTITPLAGLAGSTGDRPQRDFVVRELKTETWVGFARFFESRHSVPGKTNDRARTESRQQSMLGSPISVLQDNYTAAPCGYRAPAEHFVFSLTGRECFG